MMESKRQQDGVFHRQAALYRVLNHPVRLAILDILRDGEQCVCHMEAILGLRQACISQHLMALREAGLVSDRRDGWNVFYRVRRPGLYKVTDAMAALAGGSRKATRRLHPAANCPCPKCNVQHSGDRHA